jgi:hypothetical protein
MKQVGELVVAKNRLGVPAGTPRIRPWQKLE